MKRINSINAKHFEEWHQGSGVPVEWIEPNVISVNSCAEVSQILGWNCSVDTGWFVSGVDAKTNQRRAFGQFKPDHPIEIKGKKAKYLTPKGMKSEAILLSNELKPEYWQQVLQNNVDVYITEGAKKAGSLLGFDKACIAVTGVWNGLVERKQLIADLALFATKGRKIFICFDSDQVTNQNVSIAIKALIRAFEKSGCIVTNVILQSHTKGIDDFLLIHSIAPFEALCRATETNKPLSQKSLSLSEPIYLAKALAKHWYHKVTYDKSTGTWFCFDWNEERTGIWSELSIIDMQKLVMDYLDRNYSNPPYSYAYINNVINFLKPLLNRSSLERPENTIPFKNGLYFLLTDELKTFVPEFWCTYTLSFSYDPKATCGSISQFLSATVAPYVETVPLLLAIMGLALTQNTQYQIFFELFGPGATGKSTFINLLIGLLGVKNVLVTDSYSLEHNRFEAAALKGKNAVIVTEGERFSEKSTMVKRIVGNDLIRFEKKYEQPGEGFYSRALLILATNELMVHADHTSGLFRRRVVIPFVNRVPSHLRMDLISIKHDGTLHGTLASELPGLINEVIKLMRPKQFITIEPILRNPLLLPAVKRGVLETFSDHSVSSFVKECLVFDKQFVSKLGSKELRGESGEGLYDAYSTFCEVSGIKAMSLERFSKSLVDMCRNQLQLDFVTRKRKPLGTYIEGVFALNYKSAFELFEVTGPSKEYPLMEKMLISLNPKFNSQSYQQSNLFPMEVLRVTSN